MDELIKQMLECQARMNEFRGKADQATEETAKAKFKTLFDAEVERFDLLKGKAEAAKREIEAKALISEYADFSAKVKNNDEQDDKQFSMKKTTPEDKKEEGKSQKRDNIVSLTDEEYRRSTHYIEVDSDPVRDEAHKVNGFTDYCAFGAKALTGEMYNALASSRMKDGINIPKSLASVIRAKALPGNRLYDPFSGKVILSTDATGGSTDSGAANLLAPDFRAQLLEEDIYVPMLYDYVTVVNGVNGTVEWPMLDQDQGKWGGVAFTWKSTEGADKAETEPVFKDFTFSTSELSGWTELSNTALRRSSIELQSTITRLFRNAARAEWSYNILNGSGTNRPKGILQDANITTVARQTASDVGYTDLVNLKYAVAHAQRTNGLFIYADSVEKQIHLKVDGQNRPLFSVDTGMTLQDRLIGHAHLPHEFEASPHDAPSLGEEGDVVFGNPRSYMFAVEEDIAIARSDHAEFKKGRVVFRMMCFVGGKCMYGDHFAKLTDASS